jgi:nucleotide-binding universal stress UspA family protein
MSYLSVLVYVNADHVSTNLIAAAAGVADKFSARLVGLSALAPLPPFAAEGVVIVDNATEFDIAKMKANLELAGSKFRAAAGSGREIEWRASVGFPAEAVINEARCADLIVVQKAKSNDIYRTLDPVAAILGAGRPVLVVPAATRSLTAEHVLVAWKDAREARRAVQDALPFLREAGLVTVMEIRENDRMSAPCDGVNDVTRYLARHGIQAKPRIETQAHGSCADQILAFAEDEGVDLLVAGAYGHSRLNEWVFGGMTRDLLTSSPICCLMSH